MLGYITDRGEVIIGPAVYTQDPEE